MVAEHRSFTRAAESLHLTQPAVTLQIKALEDDLTVRLFDRSGSRIALTEAGELLLGYARQAEDLLEEAEREIGRFRGEIRGRLSLGASTTIAQYLLPPILGRFLTAHPQVQPFLLGANTEHIVAALAEGSIQLGLIEGPAHRGDVKTERFLADEIVALVSQHHPWAQSGFVPHIHLLAEQPLIFRERGSGTRNVVERFLRRAGLNMRKLHVMMELDSTEAVKSAVAANLGIGFVSHWALRCGGAAFGIVPLRFTDQRITRNFQFISPKGPDPEGPAGAFLRFCREHREQFEQPEFLRDKDY